MKKAYLCFSILFFALLISLTLFTLISPDKEFSEAENKVLASKPKLSFDTILDGSFQEGLGNYLSDQFPLRESMITINTTSNKILGIDNINGSYIGKNGYYFEVIEEDAINVDAFENNLEAINRFDQKYDSLNVNLMLVPTSTDILKEYLPWNAPIYNADLLYDKAYNLVNQDLLIDVRSILYENRNDYIYFKTDHHWTEKGAYLAYEKYCKEVGIKPKSYEEFGFKLVSDEFFGSLHSKNLDFAATPDKISIPQNINIPDVYIEEKNVLTKIDMFNMEKLSAKDKYLIYFGDNYKKVTINTNVKNGKTLFVVKDSYANCFVPLLSDEYENIIMVDPRYYNEKGFSKIINENIVTDVLFIYGINNLATQQKNLVIGCAY